MLKKQSFSIKRLLDKNSAIAQNCNAMIIRYLRKQRGLTLRQVADQLQTDPAGLSRMERGERYPRPDLARRMATFYGVSLDVIYADQSELANHAA